jgi:hypothetical protein
VHQCEVSVCNFVPTYIFKKLAVDSDGSASVLFSVVFGFESGLRHSTISNMFYY